MDRPLLPDVADHLGGRLFVVLWGGMAAAALSDAGPDVVSASIVLLLTGACVRGLRLPGTLAVAGAGWMVLDGFVAHHFGDLAFAWSDLALVGLVLAAVATAAVRTTGVGRR